MGNGSKIVISTKFFMICLKIYTRCQHLLSHADIKQRLKIRSFMIMIKFEQEIV